MSDLATLPLPTEVNAAEPRKPVAAVVLFNDTGDAPHVGCLAVSNAHRRLLDRAGLVLRRVFYNREWQAWSAMPVRDGIEAALRSAELREAFAVADAVLVNGEGTIHHACGRHLLAIVGAAQRLGWPTHLFNAVLQDIDDDEGLAVLRSLTSCAVRDACSAAWLRQHGIAHELHWDSLIEADFARDPIHDFTDRAVFTECHPEVAGRLAVEREGLREHFGPAVVDYLFEGPERAGDWRHAVADFRRARLIVTGRQHAMYVALLAGVPFVPLPSNSWKVQGLLRRFAEFPEWFAAMQGPLAERAAWAMGNARAFAAARARLLAARPLKPFAHVRGGRAPAPGGRVEFSEPARERVLVNAAGVVAAGGRVLCVGAGDLGATTAWSREGFTVAAAEPARRFASRAAISTLRQLHLPDRSFDLVAVGRWLEELDESLLPGALAELARISADAVLLSLAGRPSPQAALARVERGPEWWEARLLESGFTRHPRALRPAPEDASASATPLVIVQAPSVAAREPRRRHPAIAAADLLQSPGPAARAALARYAWAAGLIRPGDVVLDVACGAGHGAAILWDLSEAAQVQGWDHRADFAAYAREVYGTGRAGVSFHEGDPGACLQAQVATCDVLLDFAIAAPGPGAERFLEAAAGALKPGGRVVMSLPSPGDRQAKGEHRPPHPAGGDVAAFLVHVGRRLLLERVCWQGGADHGRPGEIRALPEAAWPGKPGAAALTDGTWIIVAMRDPVDVPKLPYRESVFPADARAPVPAAIAFARDYENPWLVHGLVMGPYRAQSPRLLRELADRALTRATPGSADEGAALCVLAYRSLQDPAGDEGRCREIMTRARDYLQRADSANAQVKRWRISLGYAVALLAQRSGEMDFAEACFRTCAGADFLAFSPHLGTKCSEACFQAGRLALLRGDLDQAEADWRSVFALLARVPWADAGALLVNPTLPAHFEFGDGMREITIISDNAARCANGLRVLAQMRRGRRLPGLTWDRAFQTTQAELVANASTHHWEIAALRGEVAELHARQEQLRGRIAELDSRNAQLRRAWNRRGGERSPGVDQVVIFGAGDGGRRVWEALCLATPVEVAGFVDTDPRKQGREYLGLPVRAPESLRDGACEHVVVASIFAGEIVAQLHVLGVADERVHLPNLHAGDAALRETLAQAFPTLDERPAAEETPLLRAGIFGTGQGGAKVWEALMGLDHIALAWFADNDVRKHGEHFMGLRIIAPVQIQTERVDRVVIASMHREAIGKQLRALGVPEDAIVAPDVTRAFARIAEELAAALPAPTPAA